MQALRDKRDLPVLCVNAPSMYALAAARAYARGPSAACASIWSQGRPLSDYQRAMQAWLAGRNAPGELMPEAFRIRPAFKADPEHTAALDRVRAWTRARAFTKPKRALVTATIMAPTTRTWSGRDRARTMATR